MEGNEEDMANEIDISGDQKQMNDESKMLLLTLGNKQLKPSIQKELKPNLNGLS